MEELKPCPFCGGKAEIIELEPFKGVFFVSCENEGCDIQPETKPRCSKKAVIKEWNRRADNG